MNGPAKGKRLIIGLAVDDIELVGGKKALIGIAEVAGKNNACLICYHFNLYKGEHEIPAVWNSIGEILDGLIIYQPWPSEEIFNSFKSRFPSLPVINALRIYPECPGLTPDSFQGMKDLVIHLIKDHGHRKIGFIRGPENNWSADERYRGYQKALSENGIQESPELITPNMQWWEGPEGISILLDEHKLKPGTGIEAFCAANDSIAVGALDELKKRGIQSPGQIAGTGFDNDLHGTYSVPSLTSVDYDMGTHAAELMLKMIKGEKVPEKTFVPTGLVIRRSCGCQPGSVTEAATVSPGPPARQMPLKDIIAAQRNMILADMVHMLKNENNTGDSDKLTAQLLDNLVLSMTGEYKPGDSPFLLTLEKILYQLGDSHSSLNSWQNVLSAMRRQLLPFLDRAMIQSADSLFHQGRMIINEMTIQKMELKEHQSETRYAVLRNIETELISTFSVTGIMEILKDNIGRLGIPACYLALYESDGKSKMLLAGNRILSGETASDNILFDTSRLIPVEFLPDRQFSLIAEPLYFQEKQLGYVLFEIGPKDGAIYNSLRGIISSALEGAILLEQVRLHTDQLDEIVGHTVTTSEEIQAAVNETARQALLVSDAAKLSMDVSRTGQDAVSDTVTGMETIQLQVRNIADSIESLSRRTMQIEDIIKAVEDIVSESEVLAINASIQAARAGDKGLGFAVVAREMRALARQSSAATANISNILGEIRTAADAAVSATVEGREGARQGMVLAGNAGKAIQELSVTIEKAADMALQISAGTEQQSNAINQLVEAVRSIEAGIKDSASINRKTDE